MDKSNFVKIGTIYAADYQNGCAQVEVYYNEYGEQLSVEYSEIGIQKEWINLHIGVSTARRILDGIQSNSQPIIEVLFYMAVDRIGNELAYEYVRLKA